MSRRRLSRATSWTCGQQKYVTPPVRSSTRCPTMTAARPTTPKPHNVRLARWCQLLLVTSVKVDNQLVLRTQVGAANLLASSIDAVRREEVAGTIAGDDTILVICRSEQDAATMERVLLALAEPGALPDN